MQTIIVDQTNTVRRLRVRQVSICGCVQRTIETAQKLNSPAVRVVHGGDVCNSYGYPAETEGCVVVAWPDGQSVAYLVRLPANKVTLSGVIRVAGFDVGYLDARYTREQQEWSRKGIIEAAAAELATSAVN